MARRDVMMRLRADPSDFNRGLKSAQMSVKGLHDEIDKTNDRTAWLAQSILALAPAATTLGAAAVPVLSGMATQMTVAAGAAGVMALGFNGVGDALGALNDYQLDPTTENLTKLDVAMAKIGEEGEEFVRFLDSIGPQFGALANDARAGMFPGMTEGLRESMQLLPRVRDIVFEIGEGIGQLATDAGKGLAGEGFADFFDYLDHEAKDVLVEFGRTIGNFIEGFANMLVAFGPLSGEFSTGVLEMSRSFVEWSDGLASSQGFQEFVSYVTDAAPKARDFLSSLVLALVEIVEAAAPVGAVMLPFLTKLLDVVAELADTPLGPLVLGFTALTSAWGRLNALGEITGSGALATMTGGLKNQLSTINLLRPSLREFGSAAAFAAFSQDTLRTSMASGSKIAADSAKNALLAKTQVSAFGKAVAPVAGQVGLLTVAMSDLDDKAGLTNTAMLGLAGSMAGAPGAAIGATIGLMMDFAAANDDLFTSLETLQDGIDRLDGGTASEGELAALADQAKIAEENLNALATSLNDSWNPTSMGWIMSGAKNTVEGIFGRSDYEEAYAANKQAQEELKKVTQESEAAGRAQRYYASRADEAAAATARQAEALVKSREAAQTTAEQFFNLGDSLDDAKVSLGDWLADLEQMRRDLIDFRENAEEAAEKGLNKGLIKALQEAGPEGARRMRQLANATEKEIARANAAWKGGRAEVRKYTDEIGGVPPFVVTKVKVLKDAAMKDLYRLREFNIGDKTIRIHTQRVGGGEVDYMSGPLVERRATGGTVGGQRTPYGDKVLLYAAPGEEVIANDRGQADRNREILKAINDNRYAAGGTVSRYAHRASAAQPYHAAGAGPEIDYDQIAQAMLRARPLYGNVTVVGDNSFKRELLADEQRAGAGGFG